MEIIFFSLSIFPRQLIIGKISLLELKIQVFPGMHFNININESVLKMLTTHRGIVEERRFLLKYSKGVSRLCAPKSWLVFIQNSLRAPLPRTWVSLIRTIWVNMWKTARNLDAFKHFLKLSSKVYEQTKNCGEQKKEVSEVRTDEKGKWWLVSI